MSSRPIAIHKIETGRCFWLATALVTAAAILAVSCASDPGPAPKPIPSPTLGGKTAHAIHVYSHRADGSSARIDFGAATEARFGSGSSGGATGSSWFQPRETSSQTRAVFPLSGGLEPLDAGGARIVPLPTVDAPGDDIAATAWVLVARAANQCGYVESISSQLPPWKVDNGFQRWFIFDDGGNSCADQLLREQHLLCVADKLAEIGDAVETVVWPSVAGTVYSSCNQGNLPGYTYGSDAGPGDCDAVAEWRIPPQADKDRFIVRDLAIHTLGVLATLDALPHTTTATSLASTCTQIYASAATQTLAVADDETSTHVFGTALVHFDNGRPVAMFPVFPPSQVAILNDPSGQASGKNNNAPRLAESALQVKGQILRAGGRLLHDLIRRDVYADMASAEQMAAQSMDPAKSNRIAWGDSEQGPYGTLAHATRVLAGRWEIGDQADFGALGQPACEGVAAIDLLRSAFGDDRAARVDDGAIRTRGQALAAQLVEGVGIVLPSCAIAQSDAGAPGGALGAALVDQLVLTEQTRNGVSKPNLQGPQRAVFERILADVSEPELVFAFERARHTYQLLTNATDVVGACVPFNAAAGLVVAPPGHVAPSVIGLQGIVIEGGLARARLATDPIARAGGLLEASQCAEGTNGQWNESATTAGSGTSAAVLPPATFQDAFHIGQGIERRLIELSSSFGGTATLLPDDTGDPRPIARGAIAELRSWAGSTMVHAWASSAANGSPALQVRIAGIDYPDFGVVPGSAAVLPTMQNAFGFVYGPPWVAECAAHVRNDCPADFDATYVQLATAAALSAANDPVGAALGAAVELTVPIDTAAPGRATKFEPPPPIQSQGASVRNSHLYMVRLHEPSDPAGRGRVLGTIPLRYGSVTLSGGKSTVNYDTVSFVDAPMQRELLHDAIDLGKWVGARPPRLGEPSAAGSSGYCVDGVKRDLFVPLDNELTADNSGFEDSWKHYLDLAQQAAAHADDLGQQLVQQNLAIDQRAEAAGEAIADLCGDFGSLGSISVGSDGTMSASPNDPSLGICLNEPTDDIVFLGSTPDKWPTDLAGQTDILRKDVLRCDAGSPQSTDDLCDPVKYPVLHADALDLVPDAGALNPVVVEPTGACAQIEGIVEALPTGQPMNGARLRGALDDASLGVEAMQSLAYSMHMNVDLFANWSVTVDGQTMMSSNDDKYWPACLDSGCTKAQSPKYAALLSAAFRYCPNSLGPTQPLGCDGDTANPSNPVQAELNAIRWRVTQALWMIAVSAGAAPPGMFVAPQSIVMLDGPSMTAQDRAPIFASYRGGLTRVDPCLPGATGECLQAWSYPNGVDDKVATVVGPLYDVSNGFKHLVNSEPHEVPRALSTLPFKAYAKHKLVSNAPVTFPQGDFRKVTGASLPGNLDPYPVSFASMVDAGAVTLDGVGCWPLWGESTQRIPPNGNTPGGSFPLWQIIATLKMGHSSQDDYGLGTCGIRDGVFGCGLPNQTPLVGPEWRWDNSERITQVSNAPGVGVFDILARAPWDQAPAFLADDAPNLTCGGLAHILRPTVIACATQAVAPPANPGKPPVVAQVSDIVSLEAWLGTTRRQVVGAVERLYAEKIPTRVVADFRGGNVGTGSKAGAHGAAILEMEKALVALPSGWSRVVSDLGQVQGAIATTRLAIQAASLSEQTSSDQLALQQIQVQGQMAQATLSFLMTVADATAGAVVSLGFSYTKVAAAALELNQSLDTGNQELGALSKLTNDAQKTQANQVATALAELGKSTTPLWSDIQTALGDIRASVAQLEEAAEQLQLVQRKAQYQAAVGTGQDFVLEAGQEVPIPVNTVLRRQVSATQIRYQRALTDAKSLAYMARRAIEQRIGVPLSAITTRVGPMDAPASWADDVCSLTGINYKQLRTATAPGAADAGSDNAAIDEFADSWVGDYVQKLQDFVAYYNVQYPAHEGDDTAVLSLRDDLLGPMPTCSEIAPNLLVSSGRLDNWNAPGVSQAGWQKHPCSAGVGKCLTLLTGAVLAAPLDGPNGARATVSSAPDVGLGISWLSDVPQSSNSPVDPGSADGGVDPSSGWPGNLVSQAVRLDPGTYVLSWWDQARDQGGNLWSASTSPVPYVARVYDESWHPLAQFMDAPYATTTATGGNTTSLWSARRTLSVAIARSGTYRIAFGASADGDGLGSVAIANVQLEAAPTSGTAGTYVETHASRLVTAYNCPRSAADLRSAFVHNCDDNGVCSYDLTVPMVIDTEALNAGDSSLLGKLAKGNYNFRHTTLALNLVGTGLRDCSNNPAPSCYGTGYIEYTFEHDATSAGILDYNGDVRNFDFGVANVQHGKALAAERYLTMPLSSNDQGLVSQPGIQHMEFRGRPLDGAYRLRIWDSPALKWDRLQDVQVVLNYRYWSQIVANGNNPQ